MTAAVKAFPYLFNFNQYVTEKFAPIRTSNSHVQDELPHVPGRILSVRNEITDIRNIIRDVCNAVSDIPELARNIRDEIQDIQNETLDVQNEVSDVRKPLPHLRNLPPDIPNGFRSKQKRIFSGGNIMAYKRRSSQTIAEAQERVTNLKAIDPALDLGSGLTVAAFDNEIATVQAALETYNTLLAQADAALNELNDREKNLGTLSGRMLAGVGVMFGKDSSEYEMAGGTRTSEIKRKGKKEKEQPGNDGA